MNCAAALSAARQASVLVVGDICLDRWCRYSPSLAEPSRETGIPRCAVTETAVTPGAGGTVAANLASLGAQRVGVLGVIGHDGFGYELREALETRRIADDLLIESVSVRTFTYSKLINGETGIEDLPRVDFVNTRPLPPDIEERVLDRLHASLPEFDAVVICDQAETEQGGVVTPRVREALCQAAGARRAQPFVADSRERIHLFRNVIATPNELEAANASKRAGGDMDYHRLHKLIDGPVLVVTAGSRGAWLVDAAGERLIGTHPHANPVDTCGAGDSLAAGLALALAGGADIESAVRFGMIVAGVTVGKAGTGTAMPAEVQALADELQRRR